MLDHLTTEQRNPASDRIDSMSSLEIVQLMNEEDAKIAVAVNKEARTIASAIDLITDAFLNGGRLVYMGAGTSGRLGVLDASECPPTFNSLPEQVVGLIAGGKQALTNAIEGAEDRPEFAIADLKELGLSQKDVLVGIATSGRTPYVIAGLKYAQERGAQAIAVTCNQENQLAEVSNLTICPIVGPEVVTGSTRLKAGTATKMVLNMLTTGAMVRIGKTYGNLMVDLRATNNKLVNRSLRILMGFTNLPREEAETVLEECNGELKTAIVHAKRGVSPETARELLKEKDGHLRQVLEDTDDGI
ncbi:MAG: N-acetylmuramic acid 6-phosphate etherase [Planctomycetes bacterium]|nr:N-acetylmuramic acid 6-phosphate etherase [Planctomycetota bacterium]MCH9723795.1 N-acetylmuramic acid 6-phosphate etherase [Planctomycetota bacterium]MCH9776107.1 N-acetylmuramic acid 6-phosphate etherase [Planctomycetota bacterium]MCH9791402.1 N-acetylmuramic acid 6-phosphate etherase [Planctomycetota bacterium]